MNNDLTDGYAEGFEDCKEKILNLLDAKLIQMNELKEEDKNQTQRLTIKKTLIALRNEISYF